MRGVISIEFHQPIAILNYRFGCHTINPVVGSTADIPLHNRNNLGSTDSLHVGGQGPPALVSTQLPQKLVKKNCRVGIC